MCIGYCTGRRLVEDRLVLEGGSGGAEGDEEEVDLLGERGGPCNVASKGGSGVVMNLTVTGSTFKNNRANHFDSGATGLQRWPGRSALSINGAQISPVNSFTSRETTTAASMVGKFRNNFIWTAGVPHSGSAMGTE